MSLTRLSLALAVCFTLLAGTGCRRHVEFAGEDDASNGPTIVSVQRFELTGSFAELANAAQAEVTGQGGPTGIRSEGQIRFRNRAGRLTLREDGTSVRVELVVQADSSVGEQHRWQSHFRAVARLRGVGRRIVNGQPVE